jgi:ATP/maltotriose-dependent transcriptional regulator MalT
MLASGGQDETIRLWDTGTGRCLSILRGERPYERLNISGVTGLTEAEKASMRALGARDQKSVSFEKRWQDEDQSPLEPLTQRELQVLRLIAHGASTREIAQRLVVARAPSKPTSRAFIGS